MPALPTVRATAAVTMLAVVGWRLPSLDELVAWMSGYPAIVVLLLITVTGETVVLAAVLVATHGSWSLPEVVLWCFVGTVASDLVWLRMAGVIEARLSGRRAPSPRQERLIARLHAMAGERPHLVLLVVKFLYGSRFLMLVYLATRRVTTGRFLLYDGIGTAVWLAVLVPLGWLVAQGLVTVAQAGRLDLLGLAVVLVLVGVKGGSAWRSTRVHRRSLPS